jgi:hypothetical protein
VPAKRPIEPLNSVDVVPQRALGLEPFVQDDSDVEIALEEMSYLKSRAETAKAAHKAAIELANASLADKLRVTIHGEQRALGDRFLELRRAALDYAGREVGFFPEGLKARAFAHGWVGFRSAPLKLAFAPGKDEDSVLTAIDQRTGLWTKILELLCSASLYTLQLREIVRVKREPNIAGAKAAYKEGRVSVEQLEQLGYDLQGGHQVLSVAVNAYAPPPPSAAGRRASA